MSRRKPRRPLPLVNPIETAMRGAATLQASDVKIYTDVMDTALSEFCRGINCRVHWASLADTSNMTETLAAMRLVAGPDVYAIITKAQETLADVRDRGYKTDRWTMWADEIDALRELVWIHREQLQRCSYSEFAQAMVTTRNRIAGALSGSAPADAIVIDGQIGHSQQADA